jgi:hypothetical protein
MFVSSPPCKILAVKAPENNNILVVNMPFDTIKGKSETVMKQLVLGAYKSNIISSEIWETGRIIHKKCP